MTQAEQWEVTCIKCSRKDVLDHEPPENYTCSACSFTAKPEEPEKFSLDKPWVAKSRRLRGDTWTCGNHGQTFKWGVECPECLKNVKPALSVIQTQEQFTIPTGVSITPNTAFLTGDEKKSTRQPVTKFNRTILTAVSVWPTNRF